jgi:hypothetical protein
MSRSGIRVGSNPTQRGSIPRRCASSTQETFSLPARRGRSIESVQGSTRP